MWWDDDPKATGFGVRAYPGAASPSSSTIGSTVASEDHHRPIPALVLAAAREEAKELRKGSIAARIRPARSASAARRPPFKT